MNRQARIFSETDTLLKEESSEEKQPELPYLIIHYCAIAGHLIAGTWMAIEYANRDNLQIPYTETYLKWTRTKNLTSCPAGSRPLETSVNGNFCIEPATGPVDCNDESPPVCAGLDLGWLIISFHALSFIFQGAAALTDLCEEGVCGYRYSTIIKTGKNPLRFLEYGISAAIMLMCIALLNGVTDINLIAAIAVLTSACEFCGLVVEYLPTRSPLKWVLHLTGWLQFLCAYGIIAHAFFKSVNAVPNVNPPDFVYVIVILLFLLYASFGAVQLSELFCEMKCSESACGDCPLWCRNKKENRINYEYKEMIYVTLSLGSKLVLGGLIFANVLFST